MRPATLLVCLALAGCATASATQDVTGSVDASPKPALHSPLPSGAQAMASGKKDDWWKEGGITRDKINAMCWMKYENGRKDLPLDKRADLVNVCVQQTLKEHPVD
jgi:hypothetical protein